MFLIPTEEWTKLLLAVVVGGIIGFEREMHAKSAGLRTITLITIGSTLFTMLSLRFMGDGGRVAANIVTGIGFLGAGAILFSEGKVKGLTTASSIWTSAAVGMAIGLGEYYLAMVATFVVVTVLWLFTGLDKLIDILGRDVRVYEIAYIPGMGKYEEIENLIKKSGLKIERKRSLKVSEDILRGEWECRGAVSKHNRFTDALMIDKDILEVRY